MGYWWLIGACGRFMGWHGLQHDVSDFGERVGLYMKWHKLYQDVSDFGEHMGLYMKWHGLHQDANTLGCMWDYIRNGMDYHRIGKWLWG
jgi:hypothetical protein